MSEAMILIKDPNETVKQLNQRLRDACLQAPVTDFELHVVDGQPMISLFAGVVEADEDDVAEALEADEVIKLGALIPEDDPVVVQVSDVSALVPMEVDGNGGQIKGKEGDAAKSEKKLDTLCERAGDAVTKLRTASGTAHGWVIIGGKDATKKEWLPITKTWVALAYVAEGTPVIEPAPAPVPGT